MISKTGPRFRKSPWALLVLVVLLGVVISVPLSGDTTPPLEQVQRAQAKTNSAPVPAGGVQKKARSGQVIDADLIRVGINHGKMADMEYTSATLTSTGPYAVFDQATGKTVWSAGGGVAVRFTKNGKGFYVKGRGPFKGPMILKPKNPASKVRELSTTRRRRYPSYKGHFEVVRGFSAPNKLTVVNVLPLQEYLKAVVPNELPARYGYEAVKAQSVAARNYAIRPREKPWPTFDICDSQYCQVYFGAHTEHPTTNKSLAETHGLIALHEGDPILALYSSAHGGHSESYENSFADPVTKVFPGTPLPYLTGAPDIPNTTGKYGDLQTENGARAFWLAKNIPSYDVKSPYNRWEKHWSRNVIHATLNRQLAKVSKESYTKAFVKPLFRTGQSIGTLKRVHVKKRGVSGKAMVVEIEASNGRWTLEKEFVIRKVFAHGNRMLPSANVVFSHMTDRAGKLVSLKANGGGFGHGVGMSQLGASWMSGKGHSFERIIQHYYKGVAIGTIPLLVGQDHFHDAARVTFYAKQPTGRLWVEADGPGEPVTLEINGQTVRVMANEGHRMGEDIGHRLKAGSRNTMVLYPDKKNAKRNLKAWIELYPSHPQDVPARARQASTALKQRQKPLAQVCLLGICW